MSKLDNLSKNIKKHIHRGTVSTSWTISIQLGGWLFCSGQPVQPLQLVFAQSFGHALGCWCSCVVRCDVWFVIWYVLICIDMYWYLFLFIFISIYLLLNIIDIYSHVLICIDMWYVVWYICDMTCGCDCEPFWPPREERGSKVKRWRLHTISSSTWSVGLTSLLLQDRCYQWSENVWRCLKLSSTFQVPCCPSLSCLLQECSFGWMRGSNRELSSHMLLIVCPWVSFLFSCAFVQICLHEISLGHIGTVLWQGC